MTNSKTNFKKSICAFFLVCLLVPTLVAAIPGVAYAFNATQSRQSVLGGRIGFLRTDATGRLATARVGGTNTGTRQHTVRHLVCYLVPHVNQAHTRSVAVPARTTTMRWTAAATWPSQNGLRPGHRAAVNAALAVWGNMRVEARN